MLRTIISIYKAMFFFYCALLLLGLLALGLIMAIEGTSSGERWTGLGLMIGGVFFSVFMAGSLAIMIENNELLRKIANRIDALHGKNDEADVERPKLRKEPVIGR